MGRVPGLDEAGVTAEPLAAWRSGGGWWAGCSSHPTGDAEVWRHRAKGKRAVEHPPCPEVAYSLAGELGKSASVYAGVGTGKGVPPEGLSVRPGKGLGGSFFLCFCF